ncbi:MAG: hypothetical protein UU01_C0012G0011 [Parcubacteria group bacterium GW2011_GWA2_40_37]|nr:MAG: hypothetical protein UU01_C0012G0011 [Parcubacteria group bacterium GW2011_GWA2_40_37]
MDGVPSQKVLRLGPNPKPTPKNALAKPRPFLDFDFPVDFLKNKFEPRLEDTPQLN